MTSPRSKAAIDAVLAGESIARAAAAAGLSRDAVYKAISRQTGRANRAEAERRQLARLARAEKSRLDAERSKILNEAFKKIEQLPRGKGPNSSEWVDLAEVLRIMSA